MPASVPGSYAPWLITVPRMTAPTGTSDASLMSPTSWKTRRAALISHSVALDDPEIRECDQALAYWPCRRVIDAERHQLHPDHVPALADMLRHAHAAVSA